MILKTPLNEEHKLLGARMVEFGGWDMPVCYSNITDEHNTVRSKAGLFDICHMGEIIVGGKGSISFLQEVMTNDMDKLGDGKALYSCMCNEDGGVLDDLFVYRFNANKFMIVVNAANIAKDFNWLQNKSKYGINIQNRSDDFAKLDLQGPNSQSVLQKLTSFDLDLLKRFNFVEGRVGGISAIISRTGYTAEDGFELYFDSKEAVWIWRELLSAGAEFGLKPIGLGARDTLRTEAGYSLYGHELTEQINPYEADVSFTVKTSKDFVGKQAISSHAVARKVVAFEMQGKVIARNGHEVFKGDDKVGFITSGTFSPTFGKPIGMAMVNIENASVGNELSVKIRDRYEKLTVVKKPVYKYSGKINK